MPAYITRAQKSAAWHVELGNGDIFLCDVGSDSAENLVVLGEIPHAAWLLGNSAVSRTTEIGMSVNRTSIASGIHPRCQY